LTAWRGYLNDAGDNVRCVGSGLLACAGARALTGGCKDRRIYSKRTLEVEGIDRRAFWGGDGLSRSGRTRGFVSGGGRGVVAEWETFKD
jgi:hypothetical protein